MVRVSELMSRTRVALATAVAAVLAFSGCGNAAEPESSASGEATLAPSSASPEPAISESASPEPTVSIEPSADLSAIQVTDTDVPEVTVPAPWAIASTQSLVLRPGSSTQTVGEDSSVTVNYVGINGRTGEAFDSSWERGAPATMSLGQVIPGFKMGLAGQQVGSRVLIGMTSEDGYAQGNPNAGIQVGDSLIFVVDIISASFTEATGEEVALPEGLPTVTMNAEGQPELGEIPAGLVTDSLTVAPMITGPGAAITAESTVTVKFRGWGATSGSLVYDAWVPQTAPVNTLIEGWKTGLLNLTAGSRAMLVVPSAQSFPDGDAKAGLAAGEAVIYVIDIVDVQG